MAPVGLHQSHIQLPRVISTPLPIPRLIKPEENLRSLYNEFLSEPVPQNLADLANLLVVASSNRLQEGAEDGSETQAASSSGR